MTEPAVSVVVASYMHGAYVHQAVRSVLEQDDGDLELIVVDDGSTDGSPDLVADAIAGDPRGRLLQHPGARNCGLPETLRLGCRVATGRVLAFLASDDAWLPNRLSSQRHDVEVAGAGYAKVAIVLDDETHLVDTPRYGVDGRRVFHQLLWKNVIPASTIMVRREVFDRAGGFYGNPRFEDLDLMLRVSAITPVSYHPAVVGRHRMLGTGIEETTRSEGRVVAASLEAIDRLVAWPGLPASLRPEATRWQSAWRVLHDIAGGADVGELDVGVAARLGRLVVIHELYLSPAQLERVKAFQRRASLRSQGVLRAAGVATMISEQVRQEGAFGAATSWSRRVARPVRQRLRRLLIRAELD